MRMLLLAGLLLAGTVHVETRVIDLKGDDAMKFDKPEVTVSASCKTITINLTHIGKLPAASMGHNVVIAATGDVQAIGTVGMDGGGRRELRARGDARARPHASRGRRCFDDGHVLRLGA